MKQRLVDQSRQLAGAEVMLTNEPTKTLAKYYATLSHKEEGVQKLRYGK